LSKFALFLTSIFKCSSVFIDADGVSSPSYNLQND